MIDRQVIAEITTRFLALSDVVPLNAIRDEAQYDRAVAVLNQLLDAGGADQDAPLAGLVNVLGLLIGSYEDAHTPTQELERKAKALLPRAIEIAEEQHAGQVDKAGQSYIEHPKRVMRAMRTYAERVVAVLHDVIEDGNVTKAYLVAEGFPPAIIKALVSVTRREGEIYEDFVARAAADPIGRWVKYEDLRDNCDLTRIQNPTEADLARTAKYRRAMRQLEAA